MAKNKENKSSFINDFLHGTIVSYKFFAKHWPHVACLMIFIIVFIASKYTVQTQMEQIIKLNKDLNNAKTEMVRESANFNSRTREPEMRQMLDTLHIGLTSPEQPPFH